VVDLVPVFESLGSSVVSAAAAGLLAYRQGREGAEDARDRDVEQRLRDCEFELADLRATVRERKQRR
jgi:hypothetical protein